MACIDIFTQPVSLVCMIYHIAVRTAPVIRHKTDIVFPRSGIFIIHITDDLIHHIGCLSQCSDRETAYSDIDSGRHQFFSIIAIIQKTEIIVYNKRSFIQ